MLWRIDVQQDARILDRHFGELVGMVPEEGSASDVSTHPLEFGSEGSIDQDGVASSPAERRDEDLRPVAPPSLDEGVHRRGRDEGLIPEDDQVALGIGRRGAESDPEGRAHAVRILRVHHDRGAVQRNLPSNAVRLRAEDHNNVSDPRAADGFESMGEEGTARKTEQGLELAHPRRSACRQHDGRDHGATPRPFTECGTVPLPDSRRRRSK